MLGYTDYALADTGVKMYSIIPYWALCFLMSSVFFPAFAQKPSDNASSEQREIVFLLHGLGRKKGSLRTIAATLEKSSRIKVIVLQYPSREGDFNYQVEELRAQIHPYLEDLSWDRYHFVGHSLGGILSWVLWKDIPKEHQGRLIMLGSPLQGSPWLEEGWIRKEILEPFYGKILSDLYDMPQLLQNYELDLQDSHNKIEIAGDACPWYMNIMEATHYVESPHDCFVTIPSALASAAEKKIVCPVSHEGLLSEKCSILNILQWLESDDPQVLL